MATIYSNGGNRWNILGFNFTKRDALSSLYKIYMVIPSFARKILTRQGCQYSCVCVKKIGKIIFKR
jgi:hypothetical protein